MRETVIPLELPSVIVPELLMLAPWRFKEPTVGPGATVKELPAATVRLLQ